MRRTDKQYGDSKSTLKRQNIRSEFGTSLVVQWLRLSSWCKGPEFHSPVGELDPTCHN